MGGNHCPLFNLCSFTLTPLSGSILQQMLLTPNLPFSIPHAILAATTASRPKSDPEFTKLTLSGRPPKGQGPITPERRQERALAIARRMIELNYDEEWLVAPKNKALVEAKILGAIVARPSIVIGQYSAFI